MMGEVCIHNMYIIKHAVLKIIIMLLKTLMMHSTASAVSHLLDVNMP